MTRDWTIYCPFAFYISCYMNIFKVFQSIQSILIVLIEIVTLFALESKLCQHTETLEIVQVVAYSPPM